MTATADPIDGAMAGSMFAGASVDRLDWNDVPDWDDSGDPAGADKVAVDTCQVCGKQLHYSGKGRHPTRCDDHKAASHKGSGKAPARRGKGKPSEGLATALTIGWALGGTAVQMSAKTPGQVASGRVMQLQAPDAGIRLERVLRPYVAKMGWLGSMGSGPGADLAAVLVPPILVGVIASNPEIIPMIAPLLQMIMAPMAKSILDAQEAQAETVGKIMDPDDKTAQAAADLIATVFDGLTGGGTGAEPDNG